MKLFYEIEDNEVVVHNPYSKGVFNVESSEFDTVQRCGDHFAVHTNKLALKKLSQLARFVSDSNMDVGNDDVYNALVALEKELSVADMKRIK